MSTAVSYSCGSKPAVLCFLYFYHIPITFSFCQFFPDTLRHLCSAATEWLPYLLFHVVRKLCRSLCGSLLWSRVPDRKEKGGLNGKRRRKQTSFFSNWRQRSKDWGEPGVEEELEATGFSSASLRWESEKCTEKTHSRLPNTFHHTKGTVPGSHWCLRQ